MITKYPKFKFDYEEHLDLAIASGWARHLHQSLELFVKCFRDSVEVAAGWSGHEEDEILG
jgi:hypothetical protein